jgi:predicted component of type VI protein secretion system
MFQVTVLFNGKKQGVWLLDEPHVVIGRGRSAHIALDGNPIVSRQHAVIRQLGAAHVIEDLGGANGTFVNDAKIAEAKLNPGDRITLGKHTMRYEKATEEAKSLKARSERGQRGAAAQDAVSTQAMAALSELEPAAQKVKSIGPKAADPPWGGGKRSASGAPAGSERTVAASKEELDSLLKQMKIKAGPHVSIPREGGIELIPIELSPARIGHTDECLVRLPGTRWFGRIAAELSLRAGQWWIVARSPRWNPIVVDGSRVKKQRKIGAGSTISVAGLKLRFSPGEQG